ncbi:unnamed protein product [Strongylus vulgaris]|uniref:Uncharacterized protein n=1 Tax=Strongylus vulgaris TaxID=40348 RepID=A0A3P7IMS3_STRVU|nr:unnamed protein product [Strongylus vulgaris]
MKLFSTATCKEVGYFVDVETYSTISTRCIAIRKIKIFPKKPLTRTRHSHFLFREARAVLNLLKNEHGSREKAQIIVSEFPEEVIDELFPARNAMEFSSLNAADMRSVNSDKYLIRLHKRVISAIQYHHRTTAQWSSLMKQALFLEDISQAELSGHLESTSCTFFPESVRYFWLVTAQRPLCMILAILLTGMTIMILISECTFFIVSPTLTPAGIIVDYAAKRFHYKFQIVAVAIICYLCACAYFTVFRLKIYQYYHLDPNRHTDGNSLLFSAIKELCFYEWAEGKQ